MKSASNWREIWEGRFASHASDYEADRGTGQRSHIVDRLATEELLEFISPRFDDVVFDAGCGSGGNIVLLHDRVRQIIAIDFAEAAVKRAQERSSAAMVKNATILQGDIMHTDLADASVDKVLCLSVFHYLTDDQVRACLRSFRRVLRPGGRLIIHVKNLASLYLGTLSIMKRAARLVGRQVNLDEHFRSCGWYLRELQTAGFQIEEFNSFNLLVLERMPRRLLQNVQRLELARRNRFPFSTKIARRLGADLKIRARLPFSNSRLG